MLVEQPRTAPDSSLNSTKMRFAAGTNETAPLSVAKTAKVGVASALIVVEPLAAAAGRHPPVEGFVWQLVAASGRFVKASRNAAVAE
jgi:hypothetical protein